ncbi:ABC transporter substrate-binding protein [Ottowia pentelensis]|uniref:ABC transporter substrate-binding protein n=1 Tax=Ottowia pentelensis TaxID=511108 RepID=UPI0036360299
MAQPSCRLALAVGLAVSPPLCAQSDVPAAVTPRATVPAQAPPRVVAYLGLGPSESVKLCMNEVRDELEKAGWSFDGQVRLEWNDVANDPSRYASAAQAMVARRPDVLLATDNPPAEALMNATKELPIVVMGPTNIGKVLDAQLRPLANVTGVSLGLKGQFAIKPMEMLLRAFPQARRIGMISNRDNIGHERAQGLGLFADMLQQADVEGCACVSRARTISLAPGTNWRASGSMRC